MDTLIFLGVIYYFYTLNDNIDLDKKGKMKNRKFWVPKGRAKADKSKMYDTIGGRSKVGSFDGPIT